MEEKWWEWLDANAIRKIKTCEWEQQGGFHGGFYWLMSNQTFYFRGITQIFVTAVDLIFWLIFLNPVPLAASLSPTLHTEGRPIGEDGVRWPVSMAAATYICYIDRFFLLCCVAWMNEEEEEEVNGGEAARSYFMLNPVCLSVCAVQGCYGNTVGTVEIKRLHSCVKKPVLCDV